MQIGRCPATPISPCRRRRRWAGGELPHGRSVTSPSGCAIEPLARTQAGKHQGGERVLSLLWPGRATATGVAPGVSGRHHELKLHLLADPQALGHATAHCGDRRPAVRTERRWAREVAARRCKAKPCLRPHARERTQGRCRTRCSVVPTGVSELEIPLQAPSTGAVLRFLSCTEVGRNKRCCFCPSRFQRTRPIVSLQPCSHHRSIRQSPPIKQPTSPPHRPGRCPYSTSLTPCWNIYCASEVSSRISRRLGKCRSRCRSYSDSFLIVLTGGIDGTGKQSSARPER